MSVARQTLDERKAKSQQAFDLPSVAEIQAAFPELEILEFIGRGGMGAVYKARQKNLDRIVALKLFLFRPDNPEFVARFEREARALGRLNHPNIVTVYEFGSKEHFSFLVMEFIDGLNLRQLTAEENLSPEMALQLVPQLCDALQYAHDQGVIHRDIKPENLLVDTQGKIMIADFGLAKMSGGAADLLTQTQQVMGTFNYMAPEQRERPTEVDHRADIYSLGVVIYELLTGELPIGRFQPPSQMSAVGEGIDEIVMRALEKEPSRRYQQVNEIKTGFATNQPANPSPNYHDHAATQHANYQPPVPPVKSQAPYPPQGTRSMFTMMGGREKKGQWKPGDPQLTFTVMGGTCLDLTKVQARDVNIISFTLMGGTEIIVPHGADVDADGFILMGATVNKVNTDIAPGGMRVRIRSWGAMGGCEIRTPSKRESRGRAALQSVANPQKPSTPQQGSAIGRAFGVGYYAMASLISIAIPIAFIAGGMKVLERDIANFIGLMCCMAAGYLWMSQTNFRVLVNAGPQDDEEETITDYYSKTRIGALVRLVGGIFLIACPTLFIAQRFVIHDGEQIIDFLAITAAILGIAILGYASSYDESTLDQVS